MFKTPVEAFTNATRVKSSVSKKVMEQIVTRYPLLEPHIEEIFPQGAKMHMAKIKGVSHIQVIYLDNEILFIQLRDKKVVPHLRLLHKYPDIMTKMQVDKGAIKFILSGADIMCPGLTSEGGKMDDSAQVFDPVAIYVEGKEHAIGIGTMAMTAEEIREQNKGIGITMFCHLGDAIWEAKVE